MPLYEYQCSKCEKIFEVLQKFADAPLKKHEGCGGKVQRLMSAPSFHLKGSGWYATDYGAGQAKRTADEAGEKKESSTESKPSTSETTAAASASTDTKTAVADKPAPAEKPSEKKVDSKKKVESKKS